jgi:hypothetical protein
MKEKREIIFSGHGEWKHEKQSFTEYLFNVQFYIDHNRTLLDAHGFEYLDQGSSKILKVRQIIRKGTKGPDYILGPRIGLQSINESKLKNNDSWKIYTIKAYENGELLPIPEKFYKKNLLICVDKSLPKGVSIEKIFKEVFVNLNREKHNFEIEAVWAACRKSTFKNKVKTTYMNKQRFGKKLRFFSMNEIDDVVLAVPFILPKGSLIPPGIQLPGGEVLPGGCVKSDLTLPSNTKLPKDLTLPISYMAPTKENENNYFGSKLKPCHYDFSELKSQIDSNRINYNNTKELITRQEGVKLPKHFFIPPGIQLLSGEVLPGGRLKVDLLLPPGTKFPKGFIFPDYTLLTEEQTKTQLKNKKCTYCLIKKNKVNSSSSNMIVNIFSESTKEDTNKKTNYLIDDSESFFPDFNPYHPTKNDNGFILQVAVKVSENSLLPSGIQLPGGEVLPGGRVKSEFTLPPNTKLPVGFSFPSSAMMSPEQTYQLRKFDNEYIKYKIDTDINSISDKVKTFDFGVKLREGFLLPPGIKLLSGQILPQGCLKGDILLQPGTEFPEGFMIPEYCIITPEDSINLSPTNTNAVSLIDTNKKFFKEIKPGNKDANDNMTTSTKTEATSLFPLPTIPDSSSSLPTPISSIFSLKNNQVRIPTTEHSNMTTMSFFPSPQLSPSLSPILSDDNMSSMPMPTKKPNG